MADPEVPKPVITPENVNEAIERALTTDEEQASESKPSEEDGAAPEPASGDEDSPPEPAEPAIEPPSSWKAEDKAFFATLPPEAQRTIAAREAERDSAVSRRLEEIAGERKAAEAERQQVTSARTQLIQQQEAALRTLFPELQAYQQVDWQTLAKSDPAQYVELKAGAEALQARIGQIQGHVQQLKEEQLGEAKKAMKERYADEKIKLAAALPVFADPVKGKETAQKLNDYLRKQGFSDDEIDGIADHRTIKVIYKAWLADQTDEARKAAAAKQNKPVPRVVKPGQSPEADERSAKALAGSMGNLKRHGTTEAAASFLEKIL